MYCAKSIYFDSVSTILDVIGSFSFYGDYDFRCHQTRLLSYLTMRRTRRAFYEKQELLTTRDHMGLPPGLLLILLFYAVYLCLSSLSLVPKIASVSGLSILDCLLSFI